MKKLYGYIIILLACSCNFDRFGAPDFKQYEPLRLPNADIGILYQHGYGEGKEIAEDFVFEGYVIANDVSGNFFRTFIIRDGTGAIEINAGFGPLHDIYYSGRRIVVYAKGLAALEADGVVRLGTRINPHSSYRVEPFGTWLVMDRYVFFDGGFSEIVATTMRIRDLSMADCGKLVSVTELSQAETERGLSWVDADGEDPRSSIGVRNFYDPDGNGIPVVTSMYADFAGEAVPRGPVTITGILLYGKYGESGEECYGLKIRSLNDVSY